MKSKTMSLLLILSVFFFSCKKDTLPAEKMKETDVMEEQGRSWHYVLSKQTKNFSSEVPVKWLNLQLQITKVPPGVAGVSPQRLLAYCGIALYESVVAGMPSYQSLAGQLNGMPMMPKPQKSKSYHWAVAANTALAFMNRNILGAAPAASQASIDSLENALNNIYKPQTNAATFQRSVEFGKAIGNVIFEWSKTDGSLTVNPPYIPPGTLPGAAPGLWIPTPPNFPVPVGPYGGNTRLLVRGSEQGSEPSPPPPYSTSPSSGYYKMVKDVYDVSQNLTPEQIAIAVYYRDAPGYPGGGHFISIISQVLVRAGSSLDVAAMTYAKLGIALQDAITACFKTKYTSNLERPVQYIRRILNYPEWLPLFNTPGHPEFPSAHSNQAGAAEVVLANIFGRRFEFTNHTYDYLGFAPRRYRSFSEMSAEIGISRLYGGIHYRASNNKGLLQGRTVASNILRKLRFQNGHH
jgi:hypothetical protein